MARGLRCISGDVLSGRSAPRVVAWLAGVRSWWRSCGLALALVLCAPAWAADPAARLAGPKVLLLGGPAFLTVKSTESAAAARQIGEMASLLAPTEAGIELQTEYQLTFVTGGLRAGEEGEAAVEAVTARALEQGVDRALLISTAFEDSEIVFTAKLQSLRAGANGKPERGDLWSTRTRVSIQTLGAGGAEPAMRGVALDFLDAMQLDGVIGVPAPLDRLLAERLSECSAVLALRMVLEAKMGRQVPRPMIETASRYAMSAEALVPNRTQEAMLQYGKAAQDRFSETVAKPNGIMRADNDMRGRMQVCARMERRVAPYLEMRRAQRPAAPATAPATAPAPAPAAPGAPATEAGKQ